jgi:hypothetical protein
MTDAGTTPDNDRTVTPEPGSPDDAIWRPRALDELTPAERAQYERELDSGITELPPNEVRGLLGEKAPSLYKVDEFKPDLNAGISQEDDGPVQGLLFLLAYVLFFPLAYVMLWRSKTYSMRSKIIISVVMAVGVAIAVVAFTRH